MKLKQKNDSNYIKRCHRDNAEKLHYFKIIPSKIDRKNWVIKIYYISERKIIKDIIYLLHSNSFPYGFFVRKAIMSKN